MNALRLLADWKPKPEYAISARDLETRIVTTGSMVWHNPRLEYAKIGDPELAPDQVMLHITKYNRSPARISSLPIKLTMLYNGNYIQQGHIEAPELC